MSDEPDESNDDSNGFTQEEWNAFWNSLFRYKNPNALRDEVFRNADEIWADVSPRFNASQQAYIVVQDGQFRANMAGHVLVTAMAYTAFRATLDSIFNESVLSQLSEELQAQVDESDQDLGQQFRPENECPNCGATFDPGMSICPQCGKEL